MTDLIDQFTQKRLSDDIGPRWQEMNRALDRQASWARGGALAVNFTDDEMDVLRRSGFLSPHDDASLVRAAIMYCIQGMPKRTLAWTDIYWPWEVDSKALVASDPTRCLEKAGALIAAEIDRRSAGSVVRDAQP